MLHHAHYWDAPFQTSASPPIFTPLPNQASVSLFNPGPTTWAATSTHLQEFEYLSSNMSSLANTGETSLNGPRVQISVGEKFYPQIQHTDFSRSQRPQISCDISNRDVSPDPTWSWSMPASQHALLTTSFGDISSSSNSLTSRSNSPCSSPTSEFYKEPKKLIEIPKRSRTCPCVDCGKQFNRRAELNRHRNSVHREGLEEKSVLFPCKYRGCSRSGTNGFKRKDNYIQHLRGPHNETIQKRRRGGRGVNSQDPSQLYSMGQNNGEFEKFDGHSYRPWEVSQLGM